MDIHFLSFLVAIFVSALSGSFGHCVGMCGGIVIGLNMKKLENDNMLRKIICNIIYFLGRISGYVIIGICVFLIGKSVININNYAKGIVFIIVGILIILTSFLFNFMPKKLSQITPTGKYAWYKKSFSLAFESRANVSFYILGFLNGLLPCGFVYMFVLTAAGTNNIFECIATMIIFGLGTFASLFIVGIMGGRLFVSRFRVIFLRIAFIIMLFFGFSSIYKGYKIMTGKMMQHNMNMQMKPMNEMQKNDMHSHSMEDMDESIHHSHMQDSKDSKDFEDSMQENELMQKEEYMQEMDEKDSTNSKH